ncbi:hypothetical protein C8R46DRAFT_1224218 [Mycena filopes]|nr:hypothetical protein C8R46DRAFT_1224218 [Mycena filopes]
MSILDVYRSFGGSLPLVLVQRVARDVPHALQYTHECGVIHTDIKGANILLTGIDFPEGQTTADVEIEALVSTRMDQFPAELVDAVIRQSSDDLPTLRSSALVCRTFLPSSQACIFSSVELDSSDDGIAQRLHETLVRSPHLSSHIKELRIRHSIDGSDLAAWDRHTCAILTLLDAVTFFTLLTSNADITRFRHWPRRVLPSFAAVVSLTTPLLSMAKKEDIKARLAAARAGAKKEKSRKKGKEDKENAVVSGRGGKPKGKATRNLPVVQWAKKSYWGLTDELLTIIEGKPRYKQALGFDKGVSGPVDTGGQTIIGICADIAEELFITNKTNTIYTTDDLANLATVVKNRVGTLKKKYGEHHKTLGATGHGLVTTGQEGEIKENTEIANAWDAILEVFPWYKRMDVLMGSSPIINRSAVAHSQTRVDLGVLDRDGEAHDGPIDVDSDTDTKISWAPSSPVAPPRRASVVVVSDEELGRSSDDDIPATPAVKKVKVKAETPVVPSSSARGSKRKTIQDHIQDLTTQDRAQRLKLAELREEQKTVRAQAKYDAKNNLELARLQHQQREADRQREHEMLMLERQIQLENLRRNPVPAMGMYGPGAPAYGAPPPNFPLDPTLR